MQKIRQNSCDPFYPFSFEMVACQMLQPGATKMISAGSVPVQENRSFRKYSAQIGHSHFERSRNALLMNLDIAPQKPQISQIGTDFRGATDAHGLTRMVSLKI
ncbi:MAG: hypothetical protein Q9P14_00530 [candidate division KSB1 bacterium]|nr:hypothetical protein [candidate division KSB1 bacterium]MDQ7064977.1 hypothetical protein [candidate division KSB1 bacterium]